MNGIYIQEYIFYLVPMLLVFVFYIIHYKKRNKQNIHQLQKAIKEGYQEPTTLHPRINYNWCSGAGACVSACPENNVLGLINGKVELINPSKCIGHGVCKVACPMDAISLVFGTETRGVEIPDLGTDFQTNVPGIYIAGELGGMGLIRNAIIQGTQAIDAIAKCDRVNNEDVYDVLIVGAGPAGFAASLRAQEKQMKYITLEQDSLGGTVAHFPRAKIVMTAPVYLPLVGDVKFTETVKETLIEFWHDVAKKTKVNIQFNERMMEVTREQNFFSIKTNKGSYQASKILLAIGRRGTPRKLDVPGEDSSKVVYRLIDPSEYAGKHVLVVGGGDSALEAALSISDENNTTVSLSYRSKAFSRAKEKNQNKIDQAAANGKVNVMLGSVVKEITDDEVTLVHHDESVSFKNDAVIVCAGGILPTPFLQKLGINVEMKYGTE